MDGIQAKLIAYFEWLLLKNTTLENEIVDSDRGVACKTCQNDI